MSAPATTATQTLDDQIQVASDSARRHGAPGEVVGVWTDVIRELTSSHPEAFDGNTFARRLLFQLLLPRLNESGIEALVLRAFHLVDGLWREPKNTRALIDGAADVTVAEDAERVLVGLLAPMLEQVPSRDRVEQRLVNVRGLEVFDFRPIVAAAVPTDVIAISARVAVVTTSTGEGIALALDDTGDSRVLGNCVPDQFAAVSIAETVAAAAAAAVRDWRAPNGGAESSLTRNLVASTTFAAGFVVSIVHYSQRIFIHRFGGARE